MSSFSLYCFTLENFIHKKGILPGTLMPERSGSLSELLTPMDFVKDIFTVLQPWTTRVSRVNRGYLRIETPHLFRTRPGLVLGGLTLVPGKTSPDTNMTSVWSYRFLSSLYSFLPFPQRKRPNEI